MDPYEVLYWRKFRSPIGWFEVNKTWLIGPNLVNQDMEKVEIIQDRLKTTQSHHKCHIDVRKKDLEFEIEDIHHLLHLSFFFVLCSNMLMFSMLLDSQIMTMA